MRFGSEFHALMEAVGWIDETPPVFPDSEAGRAAAALLASSAVTCWFRRDGRNIRLFREQPILAQRGGDYLSGVIDRLHVHESASGQVTRVEVLDYKTDAVESLDELAARYSAQMAAYRSALELVFPGAEITCVLLSSRLMDALVLDGGLD